MFWNLQFIRSPRHFRLTPPSSSRHRLCWRTATSTHFWSSTFYTKFHREAMLKSALESLDTASRFEAKGRQYHALFSLEIKFTKRVELWTDLWQVDDIFESLVGSNSLYGSLRSGDEKTDCFAAYKEPVSTGSAPLIEPRTFCHSAKYADGLVPF